MNIYKRLYSVLKEKLFEFGKKIKAVQYDDAYWRLICDGFEKETVKSWEVLLGGYIYNCCNEEDRKFIDLYFFKKNSLMYVSTNFPLSERACQEWREETLKNLIGLAVQEKLLCIDVATIKKDAAINKKKQF